MTLVVPDTAEVKILERVFATGATLRLYTNDLTPDEDTVIGDLTEATEAGYSAISLPAFGAGGGPTIATASGTTTARWPQTSFTMTEAGTWYGYYVTDLSGNLLWVERFTDGPYTYGAGGGAILLTAILEGR